MASEKSPSIYADRSTIGSSEELDEYGVWVKSEPQDLSSPRFDGQEDIPIPDMELPDFAEEPETGEVIESIDDFTMDDNFDDFDEGNRGPSGGDSDIFGENSGMEELPDFAVDDADNSEDIFEDFGVSGDAAPEETDYRKIPPDDFADFDIPSEEAPDEAPPAPASPSRQAKPAAETSADDGDVDLSTRLLLRIAEELAAIKGELSDLKQELAVVRGEVASGGIGEAAPGAGRGGGFFDEEEDEKIALTGDEMDNILHTAEFTKETGSDATETMEDEFSGTPDEIPGEPEPSPAGNIRIEDSAELRKLMEQGAEPLTPAPEDTSYLDEDPLALPQEDLGELPDLSLGETPDLSLDDTADLSLDETADLSLDETADLSLDETADLSLDKTPDLSLDETPDLSLDDTADLSLGETPDLSLDETADLSLDETADLSLDETADLSLDDTVELSLDETADLSLGETADLSIDETPDLSLDETADISLDETPDISLDATPNLSPEEISELSLDEMPDLSLDESVDISPDESPAEELPDFPSIDLSDAVIDEPDLGAALQENPIEEPSLDNFSIDLDTEEAPAEEEPKEPAEEEILIEPSMEIADLNADDLLDSDTEAILNAAALVDPGEEETPVYGTGAINLGDTGDLFEIADSFPRKSGEKASEEEDFAQVIPEGFVVESEDSSAPDDMGDLLTEAAQDGASPEGMDEAPEETEAPGGKTGSAGSAAIPAGLRQELRSVLSYMDQLLEALPEEKIEEFAKSEHFDTYKKLFEELGLV
jgi:hypothetical protein